MGEYLLTALVALAAATIGWLTAKWQTRKDYQYERSKNITESRFQKEFEAIVNLSCYLYLLTNALVERESFQTPIDVEQWKLWEDKVKELLGENAPIIRYIDLNETGHEYCGVGGANVSGVDSIHEPDKQGFFSTVRIAFDSLFEKQPHLEAQDSVGKAHLCTSSLFSQAEELLRACQLIRMKSAVSTIDGRTCNEQQTIGQIRKSYENMARCMYCRLSNIETGTRDKRRMHFWRALTPKPKKRFDASLGIRCPMTKD